MEIAKIKYFKVISPNKEFWFGTFKTKEATINRMKKDYPKKEYIIIEK